VFVEQAQYLHAIFTSATMISSATAGTAVRQLMTQVASSSATMAVLRS
jgi:hypothetical protein